MKWIKPKNGKGQNRRIAEGAKVPAGYELGRALKNSPKGKKWYSKGENATMRRKDPGDGYKPGRSADPKIWVTNGSVNKQIAAGSAIPSGFKRGMSRANQKWYNNGKKETQIGPGEKAPKGYRPGRL